MSNSYKAKVTSQKIVRKKNSDYAVILGVSVDRGERLEDHDIWMDFGLTNAEKTFNALKALGFCDVDFSKLDPGSEDHFSLIGKAVTVQLNEKNDRVFCNLVTPPKTDLKAVKEFIKESQELLTRAYRGDDAEDDDCPI